VLETPRLIPGIVLVLASMVVLFTVPAEYFGAATILSTSCMMFAAWYAGGLRLRGRVRPFSVAIGVVTAFLLYMVYFTGGAVIDAFHPFGVTSASESAVYALIAAPSNPVYFQAVVLLFDSAGYESFFRGTLQARLQPRIGVYSAPAIALVDAAVHIITLNPIWIGGTFVSDLVWGSPISTGRGPRRASPATSSGTWPSS